MAEDIEKAANPFSIDTEDPLRHEKVEREGREFDWYASIFAYEGFNEMEMLYVFEQPDEDLLELGNKDNIYKCSFTDEQIYPVIESNFESVKMRVFVPIEDSIEHDISEFPAYYLEDVRDEFYEQVVQIN